MTAATSAETATRAQATQAAPTSTVTTVISYAILFALAAMFLYPFLYAVLTSFKPLPEIAANTAQLWPETWTLNAYRALRLLNLPRWAFNSTLIAVTVTLGTVAFASLAGYALGASPLRRLPASLQRHSGHHDDSRHRHADHHVPGVKGPGTGRPPAA